MSTPLPQTNNPRQAAYLALLAALREERFITDTLEDWKRRASPSLVDYRLAQQLAFGASQMALTLDFIAAKLSTKKKLSLKQKEKALLRLTLYQCYFLERIPTYAIANEMVKLANTYCHRNFSGYLNALLRNLPEIPSLPSSENVEALSIRYSYPTFYIQALLNHYGLEKTKEILIAGNNPAPVMVRLRSSNKTLSLEGLEVLCEEPCTMLVVKDVSLMPLLSSSKDYYIQNVTPALLVTELCHKYKASPKRILDLCASPGGKLIAVHDFYPQATLYGNDVSAEKLQRLSENCEKYGIAAKLSLSPGEAFAADHPIDIIIIDAPCSNTGVLNKRPEARWRLSPQHLSQLEATQLALIAHACKHLSSQGQIWYMTCSILLQENEDIIRQATEKFGLTCEWQQTYLPNSAGWDGGYACILTQRHKEDRNDN